MLMAEHYHTPMYLMSNDCDHGHVTTLLMNAPINILQLLYTQCIIKHADGWALSHAYVLDEQQRVWDCIMAYSREYDLLKDTDIVHVSLY